MLGKPNLTVLDSVARSIRGICAGRGTDSGRFRLPTLLCNGLPALRRVIVSERGVRLLERHTEGTTAISDLSRPAANYKDFLRSQSGNRIGYIGVSS